MAMVTLFAPDHLAHGGPTPLCLRHIRHYPSMVLHQNQWVREEMGFICQGDEGGHLVLLSCRQ